MLDRLSEADRDSIRQVVARRGEGQVNRDIERLMGGFEGDGTVALRIDDEAVTATVPKRPSFLGAAPTDVDLTDIAAQLNPDFLKPNFNFRVLDLGAEAMTEAETRELATELVDELCPDLVKRSAPAAATP